MRPQHHDEFRLLKLAEKLRREADTARQEAVAESQIFERCLSRLEDYFRMPQHRPFSRVYADSYLWWGEKAAAVLREIHNRLGNAEPKKPLVKHASPEPFDDGLPSRPSDIPFVWVKAAIDSSDKFWQFVRAADRAKRASIQAGRLARQYWPLKKTKHAIASVFPAFVGSVLALKPVYESFQELTDLSDLNPQKIKRQIYGAMATLPQEAKIRGLRQRLVLTDLLNNDPVLAEYDPRDVVEAYNHISALFPNLALQPAAMRATLRRYMAQGGLDIQDIGMLDRVETFRDTSRRGQVSDVESSGN